MNVQEMTIFNGLGPFGVNEVTVTEQVFRGSEEEDEFSGSEVVVRIGNNTYDYFFPDYAGLSIEEIGDIVANNLNEELT